LPWLVVKAEQAILVLEALDIAERHTARLGQAHRVDPQALQRRDEIVAEISRLNCRKGRFVSSQKGGDANMSTNALQTSDVLPDDGAHRG
jgi:hypothetical protein